MNEKFIQSWAGHLDFIAADLSQTTGKDLPHALEQLPTRLKMLADEMRAPSEINETVSDLLNKAADIAFSAVPLAVDPDNGPAINYLAEWLRDIASEEADAKKPFHYDLGCKLREWADMADRKGLDSEDIGKMACELKSTARAIDDGLCFVAPVVGKAGTIAAQVKSIADAQETLGFIAGLPMPAAKRIGEIIDELSDIARMAKSGVNHESPQV